MVLRLENVCDVILVHAAGQVKQIEDALEPWTPSSQSHSSRDFVSRDL